MKLLKPLTIVVSAAVILVATIFGYQDQVPKEIFDNILGVEHQRVIKDDGQAVVAKVIDGDTIELESGQKVRYIGIDTPETKHPTKKAECFGQQASQRNQELVEGKVIKMEKDISHTDRYGRLLRYVWVDQVLVNEVLVRDGYALAVSFPPDIAKQELLQQAEKEARESDRGLWAECQL